MNGPDDFPVARRRRKAKPAINWRAIPDIVHLHPELASWLPAGPGRLLDHGCGDGRLRRATPITGHYWIGIDVEPCRGGVKGDGHALPFRSASFSAVVSLSVLEHLHSPLDALSEVRRVLEPGGWFVGSVAFLYPFHGRSYLNFTHLGLLDHLQRAGFVDIDVAAAPARFDAPMSIADGLFPRSPQWLRRAFTAPLSGASRAWWAAGRMKGRSYRSERLKAVAGAFDWVARTPA